LEKLEKVGNVDMNYKIWESWGKVRKSWGKVEESWGKLGESWMV